VLREIKDRPKAVSVIAVWLGVSRKVMSGSRQSPQGPALFLEEG
jgi:hypothetical protein